MKEQIVSFELAKLLKQKDFKYILCYAVYDNGVARRSTQIFNRDNFELAPTLSLVQKWLRDIHKFHVEVHHYSKGDDNLWFEVVTGYLNKCVITTSGFKTYEDCLEYGLQEALKVI